MIAAAGDIVCDPTSSSFGGTNPTDCQHRATAALWPEPTSSSRSAISSTPTDPSTRSPMATIRRGVNSRPTRILCPGNHEYTTGRRPGVLRLLDLQGTTDRRHGQRLLQLRPRLVACDRAQLAVLRGALCRGIAAERLPRAGPGEHDEILHRRLLAPSVFNSGTVHGSAMPTGAKAFWDDLYAAGADIILNGHEHNYQRYAKQDPLGAGRRATASVSSSSVREARATTGSST